MSSMTDVDLIEDSPRLNGGLIQPEKRHMPTLFTLILWWWLALMSATVLIPYLLTRHTDEEPTGRSLVLWSLVAVASTVHGAMAYYGAYRKGGKIRDFFLGAILLPLAFPLIAYLNRHEKERWPEQPKGLVRAVDRFTFALGNIWFGISQIVVMIAFLLRATVYETEFADKGNEAAYASYYNNPLMGLLCVLFFITIYCATMRKYPFRIYQVGWLTVHTGLLLMMVGCMMMYWGSVYAYVSLFEGETVKEVYDQDKREIEVVIPSMQYRKAHRVSVDFDTEVTDVDQTIPITAELNGRKEDFEVKIDRYYSRAEFFTDIVPAGPEAGAGVKIKIEAPGFSQEQLLISGGERNRFRIGNLDIILQSMRSEIFVDSIGYQYEESNRQRGKLKVLKEGRVVAEAPVTLGDFANTDLSEGRVVDTPAMQADGAIIKIERYFDFMSPKEEGGMRDDLPGETRSPGLALKITGDKGEALTQVSSAFAASPMPSNNVYGFSFEFELLHEIPLPGGMVLMTQTASEGWVTLLGTREGVKREPLEVGRKYRFSKDAPIGFSVLKILDHARIEDGVRPTKETENFRTIRCSVSHGGETETAYLFHGSSVPRDISVGGALVRLNYRSRPIPLPFSLGLLDFRQFEFANSSKAERFETNLVLRDREAEVREAVLVDMNHPLRWGGYSFFNGSPRFDPERGKRGVLLQVNANPGLIVILIASGLISLGILIVFFFKEKIRRWDRQRKAAATAA